MSPKTALVVTTIASPNEALAHLADGCGRHGMDFILIGDTKSPPDFALHGCWYYSIQKQLETELIFAQKCPTRHYARKNIGYLLAIAEGCDVIFETDDDNEPLEPFWTMPAFHLSVRVIENAGWVNVYRYFTDQTIWPRGLALDAVQQPLPAYERLEEKSVYCPIQQGLVNSDPDVDAICRLVLPSAEYTFRTDRSVAVGAGSWCPFNSQSTRWAKEAFMLMYLPACCSIRMTDIWRSFVAQRIAWENRWHILFHPPVMYQIRNVHQLMKDFEDEVPGYLHNRRLCEAFEKLDLKSGLAHIPANLNRCYEKLVELKLVGPEELELLNAWLADFVRVLRF